MQTKTMSDRSDRSDTPTENYKTIDEKDDGPVIEEDEKRELETDVDNTSIAAVNDSNTNRELPDTVTTVITVTNQDVHSSSVVEQVAESDKSTHRQERLGILLQGTSRAS